MKMRVERARHDFEHGIIPLVDVVLQLLIFFMLAGHLAPPQPLEIDPPVSASEAIPAEQAGVILSADGRVAFDGRILPRERLSAAVERFLASPAADRPVQLRADASLPSGDVLEVMELLRRAGAERIDLVTTPSAS